VTPRPAVQALLPYLRPSALKIGPLTFHLFGALVMIAVLGGGALIGHRAEKQGLSRHIASRMYVCMVLAGFLCAHIAKTLQDGTVFADPTILFRVWEGLYSFGGIAGGILGLFCFAWFARLSRATVWRFLDVAAWSFPFAWMFGRLGCSFAHDHPGLPTASWLGVQFPDGVRRFDLGLVEFLFTVLVAAAFLALDRRQRPTGFYFGLLLLVYGPFRLFLDGLHAERPHGLLSSDGCFSLAAALAGAAVLALIYHHSRSGGGL